jgi:hypothetical protein
MSEYDKKVFKTRKIVKAKSKEEREASDYGKRLKKFLKDRKKDRAGTMRKLRRKAAKSMGFTPKQLGETK